jgi:very-short-patch-repair endonuclease
MSSEAADAGEHEASIFQSDLPLETKLERARTELLDLSARNRLLNIPRSAKSARTVDILDELAAEVFRLLVRENRPFTFLAGRAARGEATHDAVDAEEIDDLAQPEEDGVDERGVANRHSDTKLQTRLTPKGLQKRLLDLYTDARTLEEEQGVNILYLALGTLKWIDPVNAANIRYAPLILVPVGLERGNAGEKFKLRWRQEEPAANLSLEAFLARAHGLKLPEFEGGDDFDPDVYMAAVAEAVSGKPDWTVAPNDIVLGFFSFAKFLMYRDLDPQLWPQDGRITAQPLIRALLSDGFTAIDDLIPEDSGIDSHISPADMLHIVDSDSSQTLAVHEVRRGRDIVIQGPPGTGKSQTIANIIASAVADGKTVLFVAEKMAALEVVKRRLDNTGVGDACLELHSNKANKRLLLEELRRTWELGAPKGDGSSTLNARLMEARDQLNDHAARLHEPHQASTLTPYQVIGELTRLRQDGRTPSDARLTGPESWSPDELGVRRGLVTDLAERVTDIGRPADHAWCGVGLEAILPTEAERLVRRIAELATRLNAIHAEHGALASLLEMAPPTRLDDLAPLGKHARRAAEAPRLTASAIDAIEWGVKPREIFALLAVGAEQERLSRSLVSVFREEAWTTEVGPARALLSMLPREFTAEAFDRIGRVTAQVPTLLAEAARLARSLGQVPPGTLYDIQRAVAIGERVAAAPDASPEAFIAGVWEGGVERAADLAAAVSALESARAEIDDALTDAAWAMDLGAARATLAAHGAGFFRVFSGEWRRANRLVKSVQTAPDLPLDGRLRLLDALARGQSALKRILDEDDFGKAAFSVDWRGDLSASAPLHALVEWMRSLRGLGSEPRLIAGRTPKRSEIGERSVRVQRLLGETRPLLQVSWTETGSSATRVFGDVLSVEGAELEPTAGTLAALHEADRLFHSIMLVVPQSLSERRKRIAELEERQAASLALREGEALGRAAFDDAWQGVASEWRTLRAAADWIVANPDIKSLVGRLQDREEPARRAAAADQESARFVADLGALHADLRFDFLSSFGSERIASILTVALAQRFAVWLAAQESLSKWVAFRGRAERARALGIAELADRLHDGRLEPSDAVPTFEMSYYEALFADQVRLRPELAQFDGTMHGRLVREFADLDRQRITVSGLEVVRAHHRRIPPTVGAPVGPLFTLRDQMARKRGHKPIRALMQLAAPAVQALKPVFMMSPLSVAQFLPPGLLSFDLLVMDEASQIQPVDALGAIARCRQVVVVGDPQQLPPTAFFAKMTSAVEDGDEQDSAKVADIESILGLFSARGLPKRMLRWHYRSRHPSLIAVSNKQFYENKLFIVPSPYTAEAGMGLRFHHIPDGIFETGGTRTNPVEAKIVARAIVAHACEHPELSLGVAAFSAAQRRAIQDQLEVLRRQLAPEDEAFFQAHPSEPFFIKNLENVQGDERDVIFISVGYGPSTPGLKPMMRFGPLGSEGGERRLNVLISRAKRRCEVFASMTDEDILPDFASSRKGVFAFKLFLHYARTGRLSMGETTARDHGSVFEEQVAKALQARGYQVHRNIGIAGFFIDLAVAAPEHPGRYLVGIECDGAGYHSARSARDRDRLRQTVLEDHGWIMCRIWSTDWLQRPKEQLERVISSIEAAKIELGTRREKAVGHTRAVPVELVTIERDETTEIGLVKAPEKSAGHHFYVEAAPSRRGYGGELHQTPTSALTRLVEEVVAVEGPVHAQELVNRLRDAWGLQRAGSRIQKAVEVAIEVAVNFGRLQRDGQFLSAPGTTPKVRDRSQVASPGLRKPEMLPPAEIRVAVVDIVRINFGATNDQVIQAVSRTLGFKSTSPQLRETIQAAIEDAVANGALLRQGEMLTAAPGVST